MQKKKKQNDFITLHYIKCRKSIALLIEQSFKDMILQPHFIPFQLAINFANKKKNINSSPLLIYPLQKATFIRGRIYDTLC